MCEQERPSRWAKTLTALDRKLWAAVTADVRPFRARFMASAPEPPRAAPQADPEPPKRRESPQPQRAAPVLTDIDQRTRLKLKRGRLDVDAKLDLHGMRQAEAHAALNGFLRQAQADGSKLAIIVTGKGHGGEGTGVLRRLAPLWLQAPTLRDVVAGFGQAARQHGGEGALYVRIRARRARKA